MHPKDTLTDSLFLVSADKLDRSVFVVVKVVKKTRLVKPMEMDFRTDVDIIDKYEAALEEEDTGERTKMQKVLAKVF